MAQPRSEDDLPEPPQVQRLRLLVSLLMVVLIGGMLVVVTAMVIGLGSIGQAPPPAPVTAERIALPAGAAVVALGQGASGLMVLTRDADGAETLRVIDPATGDELSATRVVRE